MARPSALPDRRRPPGIDVFSEETQADDHGHQRLRHGQGGQGQTQGPGVKGALGEKQGHRPPDDQGVGLPGARACARHPG